MADTMRRVFSSAEIEAVARRITAAAEAGDHETVWRRLQPLRRAGPQEDVARLLLWIVNRRWLGRERAKAVVMEIAPSHLENPRFLAAVGDCLEAILDVDDLNAPPPADTLFHTIVDRLGRSATDHRGHPDEELILCGLSTAARLLGHRHDDAAGRSYRRLLEIRPENGDYHYNLGLFCKTRGKFEEGMKANQTAMSLSQERDDSQAWNLGICATGAGNGAVALEVWKLLGCTIEIGRFGLPEGGFPECKVKLAQRPLAERTADRDDPGLEETIWIERLSPCHGIIRSVLCEKLGVDYGDVVLFDGAPVTHHSYGGTRVPVFPHLATLVRRAYQFFDFAGTQQEPRQIESASAELAHDAVIYSHSENYQVLCKNCWGDPDVDHENHEAVEKHVVTGRIAAPADLAPADLLDQIDGALAKRGRCRIYAPGLCEAAGLRARAQIEGRRFALLTGTYQT